MSTNRSQSAAPRSVLVLLFSVLLPIGAVVNAEDQPTGSAFAEIMHHYEAVRLALIHDAVDGVSENAKTLHAIVQKLDAEWDAAQAGVRAEMSDEARALLPDLASTALDLAAADSLDAARNAFYALSKPLVRLRKMVSGDLPVVAYCPMAKRSWLQPKGAVTNPYYGQSMLRCGDVVDG